jgi:hypothetical protein
MVSATSGCKLITRMIHTSTSFKRHAFLLHRGFHVIKNIFLISSLEKYINIDCTYHTFDVLQTYTNLIGLPNITN